VHIAEIRSFNSEMQLTAEDKVDTSRYVLCHIISLVSLLIYLQLI